MKVASYYSLKGKTQKEFNIWINSLPVRLRPGQIELLWLKSKGKKAVLWSEKGFIFYEI